MLRMVGPLDVLSHFLHQCERYSYSRLYPIAEQAKKNFKPPTEGDSKGLPTIVVPSATAADNDDMSVSSVSIGGVNSSDEDSDDADYDSDAAVTTGGHAHMISKLIWGMGGSLASGSCVKLYKYQEGVKIFHRNVADIL